MTSMGNLGAYGMNTGMGANWGPTNMGPMPAAQSPAYANPSYGVNHGPMVSAHVAPVAAVVSPWTTTGTILVLYILLVIISRTFFI